MNDATGYSHPDSEGQDGVDFTPGEAALYTKLEELMEQVAELSERVSNLNLSYNDGFTVD